MTAATDYRASLARVRGLLEAIGDEVTSHEQKRAANPSYGAVGDLNHVAVLLTEAHAFIRQDVPGITGERPT